MTALELKSNKIVQDNQVSILEQDVGLGLRNVVNEIQPIIKHRLIKEFSVHNLYLTNPLVISIIKNKKIKPKTFKEDMETRFLGKEKFHNF